MEGNEVEAKFYLAHLPGLRLRLEQAGALLTAPRVLEVNLRFDTPERALSRRFQVLRLRKDAAARMTYKGPPQPGQSVAVRREIEFEVGSFEAARSLLEALGYEVMVVYEKYRAAYRLSGAEISLDEMPYGNFCEIEAQDAHAIQLLAGRLGLDWDARITASYLELFERLKTGQGLPARHLTFEELAGRAYRPEELGVRPGDR